MTDSESSGTEEVAACFPGLPIPYSVFKRHVRNCKQPECFSAGMGRRGGVRMHADAGDRDEGGARKGPHWIQLSMPRTRSVVYYPEELAHEGHTADRESVLVTHANLRLVCSCPSPPCCLPSLLNRLCATYNRCSLDHEITQHRGHLSSDQARYYFTLGNLNMTPSKVKIVSSLIKAMGLLLAMLIAGLVGYLVRQCRPCQQPSSGGGGAAGNTSSQPLTFTLDTGELSGLEIVLLCAILAVTLGALACLFRPTLSHLIERHLFTPNLPTTDPLLLSTAELADSCSADARQRRRHSHDLDEVELDPDTDGGGAAAIEHHLRPPSPLHVRLN